MQLQKKLEEAVKKERGSRGYAVNYYETESSMSKLFELDTHFLDRVIKPEGKLFDAMMGRGRHILHFARKGQQISGNDYNRHMVNLVRVDLKKEKLKAALYNLDVTNLYKIRGNAFDYVICMYSSLGCIPKFENRQRAIREFARVVKPGGLVIVHTYNRNGQLWTLPDLWWTIKDHFWRSPELEPGDMLYYHSNQLGHSYLHYFSITELRKLFSHANLKILNEYYINQDDTGFIHGPFKEVRSGGFIIVGRKI